MTHRDPVHYVGFHLPQHVYDRLKETCAALGVPVASAARDAVLSHFPRLAKAAERKAARESRLLGDRDEDARLEKKFLG